MIKNLSQLKRAIGEHREYVIIEHFVKPHLTGQHRVPKKIQTNGYTSVVPDEPDNEVSKANGGEGYYNYYGKASYWKFDGDIITQYRKDGRPLQKIMFVEPDNQLKLFDC